MNGKRIVTLGFDDVRQKPRCHTAARVSKPGIESGVTRRHHRIRWSLTSRRLLVSRHIINSARHHSFFVFGGTIRCTGACRSRNFSYANLLEGCECHMTGCRGDTRSSFNLKFLQTCDAGRNRYVFALAALFFFPCIFLTMAGNVFFCCSSHCASRADPASSGAGIVGSFWSAFFVSRQAPRPTAQASLR